MNSTFIIPNFIQDLYKIYQRSCKGESATQNDIELCSAIICFLTKVYPSQLFNHGQASTTQYAFILPSQQYKNSEFISTTLRPLLQNTPWSTPNDLVSKTVFYSKINTCAYQLNRITKYKICLKRERKYLMCNLQKAYNCRQLILTMRFIRAVYDPDLIAAAERSMTALGGTTLLSSKLLSLPLSLEIPIEPTQAVMVKLADLVYDKVFVGEEEDSTPTQLDKYNSDSNCRSLIHQLIYFIIRGTWSGKNDINGPWPDKLSENIKSRLSRITYDDITQLFNDVDVPSVKNEIERYLQKYGDEESFERIILAEDDEIDYMEMKPYKTHTLLFANEFYQKFYLLGVQKAIIGFLEKQKKSKSTWGESISSGDMAEGCAYKILKMVQLSNRSGRPIVMKPIGETKQGSHKVPAIPKEKLTLIDKIQSYGYYLEANISCSNEIEMSLNQVIETTAEDGKLQKSTMSILDSSYQAPEMYDFIFDNLWNIVDGHYADSQCKSVHEDDSTPLDSYKTFKSNLVNAIKKCMENNQNVIHDLDEVIYNNNAKPQCTCNIVISHRFLMDAGILPYLKDIGDAFVASLEATAFFGNYKIVCLFVTGEFLFNCLQQYNTTYGEFIWTHLEVAIYSALRTKQLKTHLVMEKLITLEDEVYDHKPLKLEKYKQVLSKHYFLQIYSMQKDSLRVYRDGGDRWTEVSVTEEEENFTCWRTPIVSVYENESCQPICRENFYIIINPEEADRVAGYIALYVLTTKQLDNFDAAMLSEGDAVLPLFVNPLQNAQRHCTFPLEIDIKPCRYLSASNLKMRLGVDLYWSDPLGYESVAYSERLTLQEINFE